MMGEPGIVQAIGPLAIDGLMIGCTLALLFTRTSVPAGEELPAIAEAPIEQVEQVEAPAIESKPRAPRTPRRTGQADERSAIAARALLAGATPTEAAEKSGLSVPAVRKYRQAIEAVRRDPHAPIALSVSTAVVDMIRDEVRRSAV
jgi:hypothetical protein